MRKRKVKTANVETPLRVGDDVTANAGVKDPDFGTDIGGWQGRIVRLEPDQESGHLMHIAWDSVTLSGMPASAISARERDGLDWREMVLAAHEVRPATARDTPLDVARVVADLNSRYAWVGLCPEGETIQAVLMGIAPNDEIKALRAWYRHLLHRLKFPFQAEISEFQVPGAWTVARWRQGYCDVNVNCR